MESKNVENVRGAMIPDVTLLRIGTPVVEGSGVELPTYATELYITLDVARDVSQNGRDVGAGENAIVKGKVVTAYVGVDAHASIHAAVKVAKQGDENAKEQMRREATALPIIWENIEREARQFIARPIVIKDLDMANEPMAAGIWYPNAEVVNDYINRMFLDAFCTQTLDTSFKRVIETLGEECGVAFAAIHSLCLLHGDVHYGNVLIVDGHVKLIDWGNCSVSCPGARMGNDFIGVATKIKDESWTAFHKRAATLEVSRLTKLIREVADAYSLAGMSQWCSELATSFEKSVLKYTPNVDCNRDSETVRRATQILTPV